jgi:hypothetical protein
MESQKIRHISNVACNSGNSGILLYLNVYCLWLLPLQRKPDKASADGRERQLITLIYPIPTARVLNRKGSRSVLNPQMVENKECPLSLSQGLKKVPNH